MSSQASGPGDLVNQLVGDVGNEDRVSLEGSARFFAKWERWSVPTELFPPHLECLVKNCPIRGLGTLVLLQPTGGLKGWTEGGTQGLPSPAPKIRGLEDQETPFFIPVTECMGHLYTRAPLSPWPLRGLTSFPALPPPVAPPLPGRKAGRLSLPRIYTDAI